MGLQSLWITEDLEQLTLLNACRSSEAPSIQAQPEGAIRTTLVDDLVGVVPAEVDIRRAAVHPIDQFLPQINLSSILQQKLDANFPGLRKVPRTILPNELFVSRALTSTAPHSAKRRVKSGMPRRFACFIGTIDDSELRGKL